jgi:anti-sigma-K factor RskA
MLALSLPLHRVGAVLALSVVAAGAQAVVFDATNTTNHEPLLVTATSALGSLTVNANGWDTTATAMACPRARS